MKSNAMCRLTRPLALVRAAQIATLALACATMLGATGEPDPKLLDPAVTATERESASKNMTSPTQRQHVKKKEFLPTFQW